MTTCMTALSEAALLNPLLGMLLPRPKDSKTTHLDLMINCQTASLSSLSEYFFFEGKVLRTDYSGNTKLGLHKASSSRAEKH